MNNATKNMPARPFHSLRCLLLHPPKEMPSTWQKRWIPAPLILERWSNKSTKLPSLFLPHPRRWASKIGRLGRRTRGSLFWKWRRPHNPQLANLERSAENRALLQSSTQTQIAWSQLPKQSAFENKNPSRRRT